MVAQAVSSWLVLPLKLTLPVGGYILFPFDMNTTVGDLISCVRIFANADTETHTHSLWSFHESVFEKSTAQRMANFRLH